MGLTRVGEGRGNGRPVTVITPNSFCKVFVYCSCFSQLFLRQEEATRSERANKVRPAFYTIQVENAVTWRTDCWTLQGKPHVVLFWELRGFSPSFHIHVSMSDLYIPRISPHISCRRIGISMVGIYKSLTDTWMWKLGLWPRNLFSGNLFQIFSIGSRQWTTHSTFQQCSTSAAEECWHAVRKPPALNMANTRRHTTVLYA